MKVLYSLLVPPDVDVAVIGSGAAGLSAALTARANGLDVVVLERSPLVGGSTVLAGGGMWVPANRWMLADGDSDSDEFALEYLDATVGDGGPSASPERRAAFVHTVREAVAFLEEQGLRFRRTTGYPDYHPNLPGGSAAGRAIESVVVDANDLGDWANRLPPRRFPRSLPMGTLDVADVLLAKRTIRGARRFARILAHHGLARLRRQRLIAGGGALEVQLLREVLRRGIPVHVESPVVELVVANGAVTGVVALRDGERVTIHARRGVMLAAGGFARNHELRRIYQPQPTDATWSSASASDLGDGLRLAQSVGAELALLDEAWWGPAAVLPGGVAIFLVSERAKPGSIVVDATGRRYMNEAQSYVTAVHAMYERNREVPAIPSWLVFDHTYRSRYAFGAFLPGRTPRELLANGFFKHADTLAGLAAAAGIDAGGLEATVARFNDLARRGVDEDFGRGGDGYDTYYGDPRVKPNPNLAPIGRPPFYAVELLPGDLGTKGGVVTDVDGRALREGGGVIEGLYASGNSSASVMGRSYPGPGCTLAPAVTFSYRAMRHAAFAPVARRPRSAPSRKGMGCYVWTTNAPRSS